MRAAGVYGKSASLSRLLLANIANSFRGTTDVDRAGRIQPPTLRNFQCPNRTLRRDVLVGISAFFGLDVAILCLPLSNYTAKIVGGAQDNLTKARDERVALMNEVLGGMLKARILIYGCTDGASLGTLECNACPGEIGYISSFYRRTRTSITFTSIIVFNEEYLSTPEATLAPPLANHSQTIAFQSCTVA
ncbi:hypothetical protein DFH07DRAFT_974068 [Mycena maculata]|uniref:Uncharacterized protein n=1 Tax=Mycena maculata TaxID=230809 RepID=A0AAD7MG59_9AGAR|nr:hypothetical protein DFH07DRAFT_974068 [Mycena maculata]